MSVQDLTDIGRSLYQTGKDFSVEEFTWAIEAKGGKKTLDLYIIPLDKHPYCMVIRRRANKYPIELGKVENLNSPFPMPIIPQESQEGQLMRRVLLNTVQGLIDYLLNHPPHLPKTYKTVVKLEKPIERKYIPEDVVKPTLRDWLLEVSDDRNFSDIVSIIPYDMSSKFFGRMVKKIRSEDKDKIMKELKALQKEGDIKFEYGKFRRVKQKS